MDNLSLENIPQVSNSLRAFALKLTKNQQDAEDLIQETFLRAYVHQDKFTKGTNLMSWLYTILKNLFINNYRKAATRKTVFDAPQNIQRINSTSTEVENEAFSTITMEEIQNAIDKLNNLYRVPFLMHYQGYKYQEIADELSLPLGTVKNRIHIARKALKSSLGHHA
ncbi:MAG: RNA polymerase sigma factor [Bacteroidia bacterium]|nr:RNA polymerase sigma factor [Bacteroidia bacterium]